VPNAKTKTRTLRVKAMKNVIFLFYLILAYSCSNGQEIKDNFLVTETNVGIFKKGMTVNDLLELVDDNQIKKVVEYDDYEASYDDYQYFDSNQNHLLTLTPTIQDDNNSKINTILILDKRYKTDKQIGLSSTYADLKGSYKITDFAPDLEHIVLKVDELNAWFGINKSQLLENWWDDIRKEIDKSKIPNNATFDSFVVQWE
jgi:hypothetical protein